MKTDILLFTQTMHSLLKSSLPLQDALLVCSEIITSKNDRKFCKKILKDVNEGKRLTGALSEYGTLFAPLYLSLIYIGEESGTLSQVFGKLSEYLKEKKMIKQKISQALAYPVLVLITAILVVFTLIVFVLPRLESIFTAFAESSEEMPLKAQSIRANLLIFAAVMIAAVLFVAVCAVFHKFNKKAAFLMDSILLKIPCLGKTVTVTQMHDFSFAMKLLTESSFPFVDSLVHSAATLSNLRLRKAVLKAAAHISEGTSAGKSFKEGNVFPEYLTVWIRIAERNGNAAEAFAQVSDYYTAENENIMGQVTAFAEPVFILITGIIIIAVISQFVLPVFKLLGTL